ncbi:DUF3558 domain-containing protein [Pseudonocardia eucalypti]
MAGCSSGPAPEAPPASPPMAPLLPPRPGSLPLDTVDPCALLSPAQVAQLGTAPPKKTEATNQPGRYHCTWSNLPAEPEDSWIASTELDHGAEYFLNSRTRITAVAGFPAVEAYSGLGRPDDNCMLLVDVAPGQSLKASYIVSEASHPGITHQYACQQATRVAEMMVSNLRTLVGNR